MARKNRIPEFEPHSFEVPEYWRTPCTAYPEQTVGSARIHRDLYLANRYYYMNGVRGHKFFVSDWRIPVTMMQVMDRKKWQTWMVDDPCHWIGMQDFAARLRPGRLLCAGLGLGLIVHAVMEKRADDISEIVVVEINPDVIKLIGPKLPGQDRLKIICQDFYEFVKNREPFDNVVVDLWRGDGKKAFPDFQSKREWIEVFYHHPQTLTLYFGFQGWVDMIRGAYEHFAKLMAEGGPK